LIFLVIVIMTLPAYLAKRKFHRDLFRRFGILPKGLELDRPIWVHAVSVGEAKAVKGLIEELRKIFPGKKFVISTVTPTGNKIARGMQREGDLVTYLPFDFSLIVKIVIDRVKPSLFVIAETEIWPNLITYLSRKNIPVITVNGRISDLSFSGYKSVDFLLTPILRKMSLFCAQTELDKERLLELGVEETRIRVTGNMKYDFEVKQGAQKDRRALLGLGEEDRLLVCGSTHRGEEEIVLFAYKELIKEFPRLKLIIAPRHPERALDVAKIAEKFGFTVILLSILERTPKTEHRTPIFILDTIGELTDYYAAADIVFVGGSLIKKGGQNILEPANFSKPVISGPHLFNFRDIAQAYISHGAILIARDGMELKKAISGLLGDPQLAARLGRRAKELFLEGKGATLRNAVIIKETYAKIPL